VTGLVVEGGWPLLAVLVVAVGLLAAWWVVDEVRLHRQDRRDLERAGGPCAYDGSRLWGGRL
jgi:hypothetical protein